MKDFKSFRVSDNPHVDFPVARVIDAIIIGINLYGGIVVVVKWLMAKHNIQRHLGRE